MGQREVLKFLEKHKGRWFTATEVAQVVGTTACLSLRKLRDYGFIDYKIGTKTGCIHGSQYEMYLYKCKDEKKEKKKD